MWQLSAGLGLVCAVLLAGLWYKDEQVLALTEEKAELNLKLGAATATATNLGQQLIKNDEACQADIDAIETINADLQVRVQEEVLKNADATKAIMEDPSGVARDATDFLNSFMQRNSAPANAVPTAEGATPERETEAGATP